MMKKKMKLKENINFIFPNHVHVRYVSLLLPIVAKEEHRFQNAKYIYSIFHLNPV